VQLRANGSEGKKPGSSESVAAPLFGGCLGLLLLVFVPTAVLTTVVPDLGRIAAPLLCPEGYDASVARTARSGVALGRGSSSVALDCVLPGGRTQGVESYKMLLTCGAIFFTLSMGGLFVSALAHNALDRWRRR